MGFLTVTKECYYAYSIKWFSDLIFNIDYSSFSFAEVSSCLQELGFNYSEEEIATEYLKRA